MLERITKRAVIWLCPDCSSEAVIIFGHKGFEIICANRRCKRTFAGSALILKTASELLELARKVDDSGCWVFTDRFQRELPLETKNG